MSHKDLDLIKRLSNLKIHQSDINILLLGETGVGKSTFINAIANYLSYTDLKKAEEEQLFIPVASQFTIRDKNNERRKIRTGVEDNEFLVSRGSSKHTIQTYVFPINSQSKIRLIDTPGTGNVKGIEEDDDNLENVFSYLSLLQQLHAICFFFKPNMSCKAVFSQYCLSQCFSRLDKSCCKNIIFIFTNTRGTDSFSDNTITWLQKFIEDVKKKSPSIEIPLDRNIFCFDNEAFPYLAALKQGVKFDLISVQRYQESWKNSATQCWRLIEYIVGEANTVPLRPLSLKNTLNVNKVRRMLLHLSQLCCRIAKIVNDDTITSQSYKELLDLDKKSLYELETKLYVSVTGVDVVPLNQPRLVCTSQSCEKVGQIAGRSDWCYEQICQDPCYLPNTATDLIGGLQIMNCACMDRSDPDWVICRKCGCSYSVHMCVFYNTEAKKTIQKDSHVERTIITKKNEMRDLKTKIDEINKKKEELDKENQLIKRCLAKLAVFLKNNAIMDFSEASRDYILYLIEEEQSLDTLGDDNLDALNTMLMVYREIKRIFDNLNSNRAIEINENLNLEIIQDYIYELSKLKHNGEKVKEFNQFQKKITSKEYVHKYAMKSNNEDNKDVKKYERDSKATCEDSNDGNKNQRNIRPRPFAVRPRQEATNCLSESTQSQDHHSRPPYPSFNTPYPSQPQYYYYPGGYQFPPPQGNPASYNSSSTSNRYSQVPYNYHHYPYYGYSYNNPSIPSSSQSYHPQPPSTQYPQRPYDYQFRDDRHPRNYRPDERSSRRGNDRSRGYRRGRGRGRGRGAIRKNYRSDNRRESNNTDEQKQESDDSSSD